MKYSQVSSKTCSLLLREWKRELGLSLLEQAQFSEEIAALDQQISD